MVVVVVVMVVCGGLGVNCNSGRGGFVRYFNVFGPSVSMLKENRLCFN